MAITVERAKHHFSVAVDQFLLEQKLIDQLNDVRRDGELKLRAATKALKDIFFLTDEGVVYLARVKGGVHGIRRAPHQTMVRLKREPGSIIDLRNDPKLNLKRSNVVDNALGRQTDVLPMEDKGLLDNVPPEDFADGD